MHMVALENLQRGQRGRNAWRTTIQRASVNNFPLCNQSHEGFPASKYTDWPAICDGLSEDRQIRCDLKVSLSARHAKPETCNDFVKDQHHAKVIAKRTKPF